MINNIKNKLMSLDNETIQFEKYENVITFNIEEL
jgi:hypothetical protein